MKRIQLYYLSLFITFIPIIKLRADSPPIKYGKVSKEELSMKVYDGDSSAAAVVLCDYGFFNTREFEFKRILRIKILKKEGYGWANHIFPINSVPSKVFIKGATFNLENDEIVKTKLKSESIYKEKVTEHYYRFRISMPAIKVGSVFDIEITYSGLPSNWYFQWRIPVKLSSLYLPGHQYVSFQKKLSGFEPLYESSNDHWTAKNMPAFKVEPFLNSYRNYITKLEIEILSISFPGYYYDDITTSWDEVAEFLYKNKYFGVPLRASGYLHDQAKKLKTQFPNPSEELLKQAFEFMKGFSWNKRNSLFTSKDNIGFAYKKQLGNSADVNLALIQLLRKLGFEANPVVLSTRENGMLSITNPSLAKLNFVIARVVLKDSEFLLDATDKYATYDLYPV